ncbi:prenyltransferase [Kitasatospora viridis]|uniref:Prenyltransferase/squalene oxidase-like repeat protein n=1 Tax=Kitasatospora viridis TaxID=281105 RepID=A0A561ULQ1_9ACTN|nr:prenyltransferase [Kitasatospora viridis]TWG00275.1 hypothetical protein FHX73_114149 [Kitasatospora viridis]
MTLPEGVAAPESLLLPGVLDAAQAAATVRSILAEQRPDGGIPWFTGGHLDPWDHTEAAMALDSAGEHTAAERAYRWLAEQQNPDGSWFAGYYGEGADGVSNRAVESNFCAYVAVGCWHHFLATGDAAFLDRMWPVVRRALDFTVGLQLPGGAIAWRLDEDGAPAREALLTGSSSILHALRCGLAIAEHRQDPQPDWELAAGRLQHAIAEHPERFLDKARYSMDWYYPVLGGALTGEAAERRLDADWDTFVVPGLGARCVSDRPWVTGGESAELALALWAVGRREDAVRILRGLGRLRHQDGSYWTGYVFEDDAIWPEERTTWTAGALLLAVAALGGDPATTAVFAAGKLPGGLAVPGCC